MQYIIFDLEATCWENERTKTTEIIEIGAVKSRLLVAKIMGNLYETENKLS